MLRPDSPYQWFESLTGSLVLLLLASSSSAQPAEPADPNPGNLTLTGSFDVVSTYMFRGLPDGSRVIGSIGLGFSY